DGPLPLAHARNAGAATALGLDADLLVFLDVDCIPGPTLVERYARAARTAGSSLLCGPVTYLPPGSTELVPDPHPARPDPPAGALVPETRRELFWSLSFAVTAEAWRRSGGFCEEYRGYGGEDTDFALTAGERGLGLHWVGGAHAFHQHHPPARTDEARVAEIVANARLFHRRRGRWPMVGWLHELAAAGAVEFDPAHDTLRLTTTPTTTGVPT
uniref:glycosyltransferase family 2 protein n=1 Tax=Pseudonocardia pini TaxID=2758030 RepID=UPI0015F0E518